MTSNAIDDRAALLDRYRVWKNEYIKVQKNISAALSDGSMSFEECQDAMRGYAEDAGREEHALLRQGMRWMREYDPQHVDKVIEGPPSMLNSPRIWMGNDEDMPNIHVLMEHIADWRAPDLDHQDPKP